MAKDTIYSLVIHYTTGNVQKFAFRQRDEDMHLTKNIETFQDSSQLLIMTESKMLWIPWSSIERMEISPTPKAWPKNTIHGAKLVQ